MKKYLTLLLFSFLCFFISTTDISALAISFYNDAHPLEWKNNQCVGTATYVGIYERLEGGKDESKLVIKPQSPNYSNSGGFTNNIFDYFDNGRTYTDKDLKLLNEVQKNIKNIKVLSHTNENVYETVKANFTGDELDHFYTFYYNVQGFKIIPNSENIPFLENKDITAADKKAMLDALFVDQAAKPNQYSFIGNPTAMYIKPGSWAIGNKDNILFVDDKRPISTDGNAEYTRVFFPFVYELEIIYNYDKTNCNTNLNKVEPVCNSNLNMPNTSSVSGTYSSGNGYNLNNSKLVATSNDARGWSFTEPKINEKTGKCEFEGVYLSATPLIYTLYDGESDRRLQDTRLSGDQYFPNHLQPFILNYKELLLKSFKLGFNGKQSTVNISSNSEIKIMGYSNDFSYGELVNSNDSTLSQVHSLGYEKLTASDLFSYSLPPSAYSIDYVNITSSNDSFDLEFSNTLDGDSYVADYNGTSFCNGGYNKNDSIFKELLEDEFKNKITCTPGSTAVCNKKISVLFAPSKIHAKFSLSDISACSQSNYVDTVCTVKGKFNEPTSTKSYADNTGVELNSTEISAVIINEDNSINPRFGFTKPTINKSNGLCEIKATYISSTSHELSVDSKNNRFLSIGDEKININNGVFDKNIEYSHFNKKDLVNPVLPQEFKILLAGGNTKTVKVPDINSIFISGVSNDISVDEMRGTSIVKYTDSFKYEGNFTNLTSTNFYKNSLHPGSYFASKAVINLNEEKNGFIISVDRTFVKDAAIASTMRKGFCEGGYNSGDDYFNNVAEDVDSVLFAPVKIELTIQLPGDSDVCSLDACTVSMERGTSTKTGVYETGVDALDFDSKELVATLQESKRYGFTEPELVTKDNGDQACFINGLYISSTWLNFKSDGQDRLISVGTGSRDFYKLNLDTLSDNYVQEQESYEKDFKNAAIPKKFNMVFTDGSVRNIVIQDMRITGVTNDFKQKELSLKNTFIQTFQTKSSQNFYDYSINPGAYVPSARIDELDKSDGTDALGIAVDRTYLKNIAIVSPEYRDYKPFCDLGDKECDGCDAYNTRLYPPVKVQFRMQVNLEACYELKNKCNQLLEIYKENNNKFNSTTITEDIVEENKCCDKTVVTEEEYKSYVNAGMCPDPTPEKPKVCEGSLDIACCDKDGNFDVENGGKACIIDKCEMLFETSKNDAGKLSPDDKKFITNYCCYEVDKNGQPEYGFDASICPPKVDICVRLKSKYENEPHTLSFDEKLILQDKCGVTLNKDCPEGYIWYKDKCILICEPGKECPRPGDEKEIILPCEDILDPISLEQKNDSPFTYDNSKVYHFNNSTFENTVCEVSCSISIVGTISKESNKVVAGHTLPFSYSPALLTPTYSCIGRTVNNKNLSCENYDPSYCDVNSMSYNSDSNKICNAYCDYDLGYKRLAEGETCESVLAQEKTCTVDKIDDAFYIFGTDKYNSKADCKTQKCRDYFNEIETCLYDRKVLENKKDYCLSVSSAQETRTNIQENYNTAKDAADIKKDFEARAKNYDEKQEILEACETKQHAAACSVGFKQVSFECGTPEMPDTCFECEDACDDERYDRNEAKKEYEFLRDEIQACNEYKLKFSLGMDSMNVMIAENGIRSNYNYKAPTDKEGKPIENKTFTSTTDLENPTNNKSSIGTIKRSATKAYTDGGGSLAIYEYWSREIRTDVESKEVTIEDLQKLAYTFPDAYYMSRVDYGVITPAEYNKLTDPNKEAMYKKIEGMYLTSRDSDVTEAGNEIDIYFKGVNNAEEINSLKFDATITDCIYYLSDASCFPYCEIPSIETPIVEIDNKLVVVNWPNGGGDNFALIENSGDDKKDPDKSNLYALSNLTARQVDTNKAFSNTNSVSSNWVYATNGDFYDQVFRNDVYPKVNADDNEKYQKALYVIKLNANSKETVIDYNNSVDNNYTDFNNFTFNTDGVSGSSALINDLGANFITKNQTNIDNYVRRYTSFGAEYDNITGTGGYNEALLEYIKGGK